MTENKNKNDALKFAMKLIGLRRRSVFEIKDRLNKKEYSKDVIEETIQELIGYKYLDDEIFTESFIRDRMNFRPCGKGILKIELKKRGIKPEIIENKLEELFSEEKEKELAQKVLTKKMKTISTQDKNKIYNKLANHLKSKGFSSYIIREVIEEEFNKL